MKSLIGVCLAGVLCACATTNSPQPSVSTEIATLVASDTGSLAFPAFTDDLRIVQDLAERLPHESTLVVFDIDDTLLTTEKLIDGSRAFYGGDRWYVWQVDPSTADDHKVKDCLSELITYNYRVLPMFATQPNAPEIVREIQADKLLLTSRSPANWESTIRELRGAGYSAIIPNVSSRTFDFIYTEGSRTDTVIYREGIMMTSGFNKGRMLQRLLELSKKKYANVILVDDTQRHIDRVRAVLKDSATKFYGVHYTGIKNDGVNPDGTSMLPHVTEDQVASHERGFSAMKALMAEVSPSTYKNFKDGCPKAKLTLSPSL